MTKPAASAPLALPAETYDNSMISDYRSRGDRYFYFKHVLHWVDRFSGAAADWGTAWHEATATIAEACCGREEDAIHKLSDPTIDRAIRRFAEVWNLIRPPVEHVDPTCWPTAKVDQALWEKSPALAPAMLRYYLRVRAPFFTRLELIGVETPFVVPLWPDNPDVGFVGLVDRFARLDGKELVVVDVKTTGPRAYAKDTGIRSTYFQQYEVGSQLRGYLYAARLIFAEPELTRAYIDASLRHRNKSESRADIHKLYPLRLNSAQIEEWLFDTRAQVERIQEQHRRQAAGEPAWPRACGEGCFQYRSCSYYDLCMSGLPLDSPALRLPINMVVRKWEPIKLH